MYLEENGCIWRTTGCFWRRRESLFFESLLHTRQTIFANSLHYNQLELRPRYLLSYPCCLCSIALCLDFHSLKFETAQFQYWQLCFLGDVFQASCSRKFQCFCNTPLLHEEQIGLPQSLFIVSPYSHLPAFCTKCSSRLSPYMTRQCNKQTRVGTFSTELPLVHGHLANDIICYCQP